MKILLLSVLAVAMIGAMVPSVFGETEYRLDIKERLDPNNFHDTTLTFTVRELVKTDGSDTSHLPAGTTIDTLILDLDIKKNNQLTKDIAYLIELASTPTLDAERQEICISGKQVGIAMAGNTGRYQTTCTIHLDELSDKYYIFVSRDVNGYDNLQYGKRSLMNYQLIDHFEISTSNLPVQTDIFYFNQKHVGRIYDDMRKEIQEKLHNTRSFGIHWDRDLGEERLIHNFKNYDLYEIQYVVCNPAWSGTQSACPYDPDNMPTLGEYRSYLGPTHLWDKYAELQEDDTSGFKNIFKVKIYLSYDVATPGQAQTNAEHIIAALKVLVPEWYDEIDVSPSTWVIDSLNNAERQNDGWGFNKRQNTITTENKEIRIMHDDLDYYSMTLIVTKNADVIDFTLPPKPPAPILTEPEPEPISISEESSEGGGCLIATAAFGSEMAPQVQFLREIRDNTVLQTTSGTAFMTGFNQFYYSFSPAIADYERENPVFKEAVKVTLTPMLTSLTLLNYVDVDTEEEMLGYGIGIILLNIGMYFVAPAVLIVSLKKRLFI